MRDLTKKQKKLLDSWYIEQIRKNKTFTIWWDLHDDDDFSFDLLEKVDSLNPCELIYQNINNYITDKLSEN